MIDIYYLATSVEQIIGLLDMEVHIDEWMDQMYEQWIWID